MCYACDKIILHTIDHECSANSEANDLQFTSSLSEQNNSGRYTHGQWCVKLSCHKQTLLKCSRHHLSLISTKLSFEQQRPLQTHLAHGHLHLSSGSEELVVLQTSHTDPQEGPHETQYCQVDPKRPQ